MIDRKELVDIYLDGFEKDSREFARWFVDEAEDRNIFWHAENGSLVSAGYIIEKKAYLFGKNINLSYLSALSTKKEFRGKGKIGIIIKKAFEELYSRGEIITTLSPFDANYYKRYGYTDVVYFQKNTVRGGKDYTIRQADKADKNDIQILEQIEQKNAAAFDNYLVKKKPQILKLLESYEADNIPCNIIYDGHCPIAFFFYFSNKIEYYAEIERGVIQETEQLKGKEFESYNEGNNIHIQARIVDAKKAILEYNYNMSISGVYGFVISDEYINKNNISILVEIQSGKATLLEENLNKNQSAAHLDIATLCNQMFFGGSGFSNQSCLFKDKY